MNMLIMMPMIITNKDNYDTLHLGYEPGDEYGDHYYDNHDNNIYHTLHFVYNHDDDDGHDYHRQNLYHDHPKDKDWFWQNISVLLKSSLPQVHSSFL